MRIHDATFIEFHTIIGSDRSNQCSRHERTRRHKYIHIDVVSAKWRCLRFIKFVVTRHCSCLRWRGFVTSVLPVCTAAVGPAAACR